jgi:hypothetical protein
MMIDPLLRLPLIFIVNGEDVAVDISVLATLSAARSKALAASYNTGRDPTDWEVRDESGLFIDTARTVNSLGLEKHNRLFLTLGVGWGGAA